MSFAFNAPAPGTSVSTSKPQFEGNDIYEVKFDGCTIKDTVGKEDATKTYKLLTVRFSNEDGYFIHTIFEPRPEHFKRPTTDFFGNPLKFPSPSVVESMMLFFKHLIDAVNPEIGVKIDSGEESLTANSWDELRNKIVSFTDPVKDKATTKIKLLKGKNGPTFPFFTSVNRDGEAYVNNNIIGEKLFFSNYEKGKIANPTQRTVPAEHNLDITPQTESIPSDLNFDVMDV